MVYIVNVKLFFEVNGVQGISFLIVKVHIRTP